MLRLIPLYAFRSHGPPVEYSGDEADGGSW